jgi:tRNA-dihydrouridine synthase 3
MVGHPGHGGQAATGRNGISTYTALMNSSRNPGIFEGATLLAPLTKGGNLPFRRLCVELGARVTVSEMAVARDVVRGKRQEMALLRRAPDEPCFGVQLADRHPEQLGEATRIAVERGADFVDLNLGCPIDLFCRRGLGAALLRKPGKVGALVGAMREAVDVPVTIKMRLGYDDDKPRFMDVARAAIDAGVDAITLHGRSRSQRYRRAADWSHVAELVEAVDVPVIGNGDILTWRDAEHRRGQSGCAGVMVARGALIKPWIFREIADGRDYLLSPEDRLDVLRRYRSLALAHFRDDERGRRNVRLFLDWHLDFLARYRAAPAAAPDADDHPLIQTRDDALDLPETPEGWVQSSDREQHARLAEWLIEEIDRDPESRESWDETPASVILERIEGASIVNP